MCIERLPTCGTVRPLRGQAGSPGQTSSHDGDPGHQYGLISAAPASAPAASDRLISDNSYRPTHPNQSCDRVATDPPPYDPERPGPSATTALPHQKVISYALSHRRRAASERGDWVTRSETCTSWGSARQKDAVGAGGVEPPSSSVSDPMPAMRPVHCSINE